MPGEIRFRKIARHKNLIHDIYRFLYCCYPDKRKEESFNGVWKGLTGITPAQSESKTRVRHPVTQYDKFIMTHKESVTDSFLLFPRFLLLFQNSLDIFLRFKKKEAEERGKRGRRSCQTCLVGTLDIRCFLTRLVIGRAWVQILSFKIFFPSRLLIGEFVRRSYLLKIKETKLRQDRRKPDFAKMNLIWLL